MKFNMKPISALICFLFLMSLSFNAMSASNLKFSTNVKENHSKNVIQSIQNALIDAGYDPGLPDGFGGLRTDAALKSFQRDHQLKINGRAYKSALKAIRNSLVSDE